MRGKHANNTEPGANAEHAVPCERPRQHGTAKKEEPKTLPFGIMQYSGKDREEGKADGWEA